MDNKDKYTRDRYELYEITTTRSESFSELRHPVSDGEKKSCLFEGLRMRGPSSLRPLDCHSGLASDLTAWEGPRAGPNL